VKVAAVCAVLVVAGASAQISSTAVQSTVRDQPIGDDETIRGAIARARAARETTAAELGVGIDLYEKGR